MYPMATGAKAVVLAASITAFLFLQGSQAAAQDEQPAAPPPTPAGAAPPTEQTSHARIAGVMPDFLTVNDAAGIKPLTTREKYNVVTRTAFDWFQYGWYTFTSGVGAAAGVGDGYGTGVHGFGRRYATNFADGTAENYFVGAVWPSLLHQDPRYFRKTTGSGGSRAGYAMTRVFVTRNDAGRHRFNFSEVLGAASATLVANAYHPAPDRTVHGNVVTMTSLITYDMLANLLKQFWPDVATALKHHH